MARIREWFVSSDRLYVFYFFICLLSLSLARIIFVSIYWDRIQDHSFLLLAFTFLLGIRFDLSSTGIVLGCFFVISQIPYISKVFVIKKILTYIPIFILPLVWTLCISDWIYFENANKHLGYEAFVFLADLPKLIHSVFLEKPFLLISLIIGIILASVFLLRESRKRMLAADPIKLDFWPQLVKLFSAILITMILVRGGIQESPLRASSAIVADDGLINHIALNPVFTTVMDLKGRSVPTHLRMDPNEAIQIIQKISKYENTEFLNDANFPLLRKQIETNRGKVPNIVLIFLESWTAKFTKPIGQGEIAGKEITPNFNALAKEGQLFTNFYANGGRTSNGLMSVITGIPDRPGLTAVRSPQIMGNFSSLGRIFSKWGYETIFITGDDLQFDNLETLLPHWGFQRRIGKKEIQETGKYTLGAWGYDDETIYDLLLKEMEKTHKNGSPFLASALTMTTHYPYKVPNPKFEIFSKEINDYDYLNTYHYADWALGAFLEKAKKYPFFKDTIFIFVGDHTHHRTLNYYEDRNVPLLLYGPRFIDKKLNSTVSSQIDVLPTMLGLVGKETNFSAVGRNLLAKGIGSGWAYFAYGVAYGWIEGDQFLYQWVDGDKSLQFRAKEPFTEHEACKKDPFPCKESLRKGNAIFNITIELMNQNRIFPQEN